MNHRGAVLLLLPMVIACQPQEAPFIATGAFEATEVIVSAEAAGRLLTLDRIEGMTLEAGQTLGQIDCQQLTLQRAQLVSSLDGTETRRIDIPLQLGSLRQQLALARVELQRARRLYAIDATTLQARDDLESKVRVLERQIAAARTSHRNANQGVDAESASVKHRIEQLDDQIQKCTILSPISGTVLTQYAEGGELATIGRPLLKIADLRHIFLRAYITSDQLARLKLGQQVPVEADFGTSENRRYVGTIAWIASKAEFTPRTFQTHDERANLVYATKIAVENDGFIKLGMYGFIPREAP